MNRFYNNYIKKNRYKREEGVTIIDLVIAIIIMSVFVGVITTLMTGIYKQSLEVQISSNAMSYATIILEKIDEKSFEEVQNPNKCRKSRQCFRRSFRRNKKSNSNSEL